MSEISTEDLSKEIVERDDDGELIPEEHNIKWNGKEVTVKTKPVTTGLLNELSNLDDAIIDLEPEAVHEAFQTIYVSEAVTDLSVDEIRDMKGSGLNKLLKPLEEEIEANFEDGSGNP